MTAGSLQIGFVKGDAPTRLLLLLQKEQQVPEIDPLETRSHWHLAIEARRAGVHTGVAARTVGGRTANVKLGLLARPDRLQSRLISLALSRLFHLCSLHLKKPRTKCSVTHLFLDYLTLSPKFAEALKNLRRQFF
jgi:hypothetical protein